MHFRPFPKISTHRVLPPQPMGGPWVALEKLHGAQLVIASDGGTIHVGKRKAWLKTDEPFFGWQLIISELVPGVQAIARQAAAKQTVVYGELVGGRYPHPDVPAIPGLAPVQTGIWYTPALIWIAFDVLVAANDEDEGELLAYSELESLAENAGVRTPPCLLRGTRAALEHVNVRFPTRVPTWFGLPQLPDNFAEGIVLKPDVRCAPSKRPILKRKLPEFDDDRFGEAEAWNPGRLSEDALMTWVDRMIQPARLASARSKVGIDPAAIVDEVALDVTVDLGLAFRDAWDRLSEASQEKILAHARALATQRLIAGAGQ